MQEYDLDIQVSSFGVTNMLTATSRQMPNLMVSGTDEIDLEECLPHVLRSLLEAQGNTVRNLTIHKDGYHTLRAHVKLAS